MTTEFKLADKVDVFKSNWNYKTKSELWDFWYVSNIRRDFKEAEPESSFSSYYLSQLSKDFNYYFPTTEHPQTGKKFIQNPFVKNQSELSLSMLKYDQLLEVTSDSDLKVCMRQLQIILHSGLESSWNNLRLLLKYWKLAVISNIHFLWSRIFFSNGNQNEITE